MCKIFCLTNLSKVTLDDKFMKDVKDIVCRMNLDGFGYAVSTEKNELFGERYLQPYSFERIEANYSNRILKKMKFMEVSNESFGQYHKKNNRVLIAHGRTSTNEKTLAATHPFTDKGEENALIHNGVVNGEPLLEKEYDLKTTNDTELLANVFWRNGIDGNNGINETLEGYFAFMNLTKDGTLTIVRDDHASLYGSYIQEIDSFIFATMDDMIKEFCKTQGYVHSTIGKVKADQIITWKDNEVVEYRQWENQTYDYDLTAQQQRAFKDYGTPTNQGALPGKPLTNVHDLKAHQGTGTPTGSTNSTPMGGNGKTNWNRVKNVLTDEQADIMGYKDAKDAALYNIDFHDWELWRDKMMV